MERLMGWGIVCAVVFLPFAHAEKPESAETTISNARHSIGGNFFGPLEPDANIAEALGKVKSLINREHEEANLQLSALETLRDGASPTAIEGRIRSQHLARRKDIEDRARRDIEAIQKKNGPNLAAEVKAVLERSVAQIEAEDERVDRFIDFMKKSESKVERARPLLKTQILESRPDGPRHKTVAKLQELFDRQNAEIWVRARIGQRLLTEYLKHFPQDEAGRKTLQRMMDELARTEERARTGKAPLIKAHDDADDLKVFLKQIAKIEELDAYIEKVNAKLPEEKRETVEGTH